MLGPLDVRVQGQPLPPLRSRKGYWLLALLVLRAGREVRREWLAETLWPDSFGEEAFASLRQSLRDLRLKLGPEAHRIQSPTSRTLRFDPEGAQIDVLAFDTALGRGGPDDLTKAMRLYAGPLLEGCVELWVLPEREARERGYLNAVEKRAQAALAEGCASDAARILEPAVWVAPLRQTLHQTLMQALASLGEFQGAVEVYQELRRRLHHDYNTQPDPDTTRAYHEVRAAGQARAVKAAELLSSPPERTPEADWHCDRPQPDLSPYPLPEPLTPLIGREEDLRRVEALFASTPQGFGGTERIPPGHTRLVTLTGPGGVGKTRLALEVAHRLTDRFPDGALFVELPGARHEADLDRAVALALGVSQEESIPLSLTVTAALRHRELLLVLDNCEQILAECARFSNRLLRRCPGLRILATSRERLGLTGETVHPVTPLPTASPTHTATSSHRHTLTPAAALFLQRVAAVVPAFETGEIEVATVEALCQKLDGLPLALELAAPLAELMPLPTLVERLDQRFELLAHGDPSAPERHQSLRALVDWSYALLSADEQRLFRQLSVFPGSWTLPAAEAVATAPAPLAPVLQRLVAKSLVIAETSGVSSGERRFRLLATLREYATDRLSESGEEEAVRLRHLEYAVQHAEAAATALTGPDQLLWLARLDADYDHLRTAMIWCHHRAADASTEVRRSALRLAAALGRYWQIRGLFREGYDRLTRALELIGIIGSRDGGQPDSAGSLVPPPNRDPCLVPEQARAHGWAAFLTAYQGDYLGATRHAEASLALYQQLGDRAGIAAALGTLGIVAKDQGDRDRARALFEESLALYRAESDRVGEASMLGYLGIVAAGQHDLETARALYETSLRIRRELQDRWGIAASLNNLGQLARQSGDLAAARGFLEESLALRRILEDRRCIAISLNHLGLISLAEGTFGPARDCFRESLQLARDMGERRAIAYSLETIARLAAESEPSPQSAADAVRLYAAASRMRAMLPAPLPPTEAADQEARLAHLRTRLSQADYERAWQEGEAMYAWPFTLDAAIALALSL